MRRLPHDLAALISYVAIMSLATNEAGDDGTANDDLRVHVRPPARHVAMGVRSGGRGADVTVTWECYLEAFDRKFFGGPLRKRQSAQEVPKSLAALSKALSNTSIP